MFKPIIIYLVKENNEKRTDYHKRYSEGAKNFSVNSFQGA